MPQQSPTFFSSNNTEGANVVAKTTTYTAITSDRFITLDSTAGIFTVNLYPAASNAGRTLTFIKTDASLNAITIDPNASETIGGQATTTLNTQYESLSIFCDGTNWQISNRKCTTEFVAYTPTLTGFGTATSLTAFSRRNGDSLEITVTFTTGTPTATEARVALGFNGGNGNVTSDTTKNPILRNCGMWSTGASSSTVTKPVLISPTLTYVTFGLGISTTAELGTENGNGIIAATTPMTLYASIPIAGWKA